MKKFMCNFKLLALILVIAAAALTACGGKESVGKSNSDSLSLPQTTNQWVTTAVNSAKHSHVFPQNGITCTELGLIKNDKDAGHLNTVRLFNAIQQGQNICVDGTYFLAPIEAKLFDTQMALTGSSLDAELKILDGDSVFFIHDNVDIYLTRIKFTQYGPGDCHIFEFDSDCLSKTIIIENCMFDGNMRFISFLGSTTANPAETPFGIEEFYFNGNKVYNAARPFINLVNVPAAKIIIDGNLIQNFDFVFLNSGIQNDIPFEDNMYEAKKLMVVRNNLVTCDNNWWSKAYNDNYYCFILFEGLDCIYEGNRVEGLKFFNGDGGGAAVYDSYLSCQNLVYRDNVWKNNLSFNPEKSNNTLLKSKGGPEDAPITRIYQNNTYVIDRSYIEMCSAQLAKSNSEDPVKRLEMDLSASWIDFLSLDNNCSTYSLANNTFDIYDLRLFSRCIPVEQMNMEGNIFKCTRIGGAFLYYHAFPNVDYSEKHHVLRDNTIIAAESNELGPLCMVRAHNSEEYGQYGTVSIEDNTVSAPCSHFLNGIKADQVIIRGNTVTSADWFTSEKLLKDSKINVLITENNTFNLK